MVALTTHTVVSHGDTRLLAGIGLGAAGARNAAMVVLVEEFRLTKPTSASVPVLLTNAPRRTGRKALLEQPAAVQPKTNDYGADVASSSLQVRLGNYYYCRE